MEALKVKFDFKIGQLFAMREGEHLKGSPLTVLEVFLDPRTPIESQYVSLFGVRIEMSVKSCEHQISQNKF